MNPYLDDDLIALSDQARRFASDRIAPGFQERDRTRVLDRAIMKEMGAMGFIAPELPEKFGGLGLGCLAAGVIHEEVARADLSISYINLLASLNGQILSQHGKPDIVRPWLARLTAGEALFAELLLDDEPHGDDEKAFALKLAFCRHLESEQRLTLLLRRRQVLAERLERQRGAGAGHRDRYTRSLVEHRTKSTQRDLEWVDELIAAERAAPGVESPAAAPRAIEKEEASA